MRIDSKNNWSIIRFNCQFVEKYSAIYY